MNKRHFAIRSCCPWCGSGKVTTALDLSYEDIGLRGYLRGFYERQGMFEQSYLEGVTYAIDECLACSMIYQRNIPNPDFMQRLYGVWIDPVKSFEVYEHRRPFDYYAGRAENILRTGSLFGQPPHETRILDYSMGWGQWARIAAALGFRVFGTEYIKAKRDHAEALGITVIDEAKLDRHRFDLVHADQVLEHVPDPARTLERLCRLVVPGGLLSIGVPYGGGMQRRLAHLDWSAAAGSPDSMMPIRPLEHINSFQRHMLQKRVEEYGFAEIDPAGRSIGGRIYRRTRSLAGRVVRYVRRIDRLPLTIDILAHRAP